MAGLLAAFLVGAPLVALAAGRLAYDISVSAQRATRHQIHAVLLHDAPPPVYTPYGIPVPLEASARWMAPDGTPRTGNITVQAGTPAGTTVTVWADVSGRLHAPPPTHDKVVGQTIVSAVYAPMVLALVLLAVGMLVHRSLDRRRIAAWDAEWSVTGMK